MDVAIVGNFDVVQRSVNPNFSRTGYWYDYFSGDSVNVSNTQAQISLEPGQFYIYTTKKLPTPPSGILLSAEESGEDYILESFTLQQNYPNPFNPSTTIKFSIPESGEVSLKIYDVIGKEVATLVDEFKSVGNYEISFNSNANGLNLSSGIYFYQLKINSKIETRKMILLQ